jgi:hypothetical protein
MATPTYTPIQTYTVTGSAVSSVTLGSGGTIPQTYTDLILVINTKGTVTTSYPRFQFNGDTGSNYSRTALSGSGSAAQSSRDTNLTAVIPEYNSANQSSGFNFNSIIHIMNYSNTTTYKTVLSRSNNANNGVDALVSLWRSTSAINSIYIFLDSGSYDVGSTFTLYGIANADIGAPKATGGIITYDNTYFYHTFGASGTFTPQQSLTCDYLVIAGGGGAMVGGGGAGGYRSATNQSLTTTAYTITVGAGGSGGTSYGRGSTGGNSSIAGSGFTTITASGGGAGGANDYSPANTGGNGGSGGGGAGNGDITNSTTGTSGGSGNAGSYSPVEGYAGGAGLYSGTNIAGGGGGGAGGVGSSVSPIPNVTAAGNGGIGSNAHSSWSLVTGTGVDGYYAGGGGGGGRSVTVGSGGLGGGGTGILNSGTANKGAVNTGSGGGGAYVATGGTGGSGVVIIRYLKA